MAPPILEFFLIEYLLYLRMTLILIMVTVIRKGSSKLSIRNLLKKLQEKKRTDIYKYCGVIKLDEHPVKIKKNLRSDWK